MTNQAITLKKNAHNLELEAIMVMVRGFGQMPMQREHQSDTLEDPRALGSQREAPQDMHCKARGKGDHCGSKDQAVGL